MTKFFSRLKTTFFGSVETKTYKEHRSLFDNFVSMCSLPFHKPPSNATKDLMNIIQDCHLHSSTVTDAKSKSVRGFHSLTQEESRHDIAMLHLISLAISDWQNQRDKPDMKNNRSKRGHLINHFMDVIQRELYSAVSIHNLRFKNDYIHPHNHHDKIKLKSCLPNDKLKVYYGNQANVIDANSRANEIVSNMRHNRLFAIFMPVLNFIFDMDCFDVLFDGVNVVSDFANIMF